MWRAATAVRGAETPTQRDEVTGWCHSFGLGGGTQTKILLDQFVFQVGLDGLFVNLVSN